MPGWREPRREDRQLAWLWFAAALAAPLLAWVWPRLGLPYPGCTFHHLTGLPCPTCGAGRAVVTALHGHPLRSFRWNPLVTSVIAVFEGVGLAAPFWLLAGGKVPSLARPLPRWVRWAALVALVVNWIYLVLSGV